MLLVPLLACVIGECSMYDDEDVVVKTIAGPAGVGGFTGEMTGFTTKEAELSVFRTDGETEDDIQDPSNDSSDDDSIDDDSDDCEDEDDSDDSDDSDDCEDVSDDVSDDSEDDSEL